MNFRRYLVCRPLGNLDQAEELLVAGCGERITRIQECELKDTTISDQLGTHILDKLACCRNGTTGGNEVIDDKDAIAGLKGVRVDFERIGAVFEFVACLLYTSPSPRDCS